MVSPLVLSSPTSLHVLILHSPGVQNEEVPLRPTVFNPPLIAIIIFVTIHIFRFTPIALHLLRRNPRCVTSR